MFINNMLMIINIYVQYKKNDDVGGTYVREDGPFYGGKRKGY